MTKKQLIELTPDNMPSTIKEHREGQRLSVRTFARMNELSATTVQRIEGGVNSPSFDTLHRMATNLGKKIYFG